MSSKDQKKRLKDSAAIPAAAAPAAEPRKLILPEVPAKGETQPIAQPNGVGHGTAAPAPAPAPLEMEEANCGNCLCFVTKDGETGECRGGPPTSIVIGVRPHPITQQPQPIIDGYFPPTHKKIWCGRWNGPARHVEGKTLIPVLAFKEVNSAN